MPATDYINDAKMRRQMVKKAEGEADQIFNKLNQKGDYAKTAYKANQNTGKGNYAGLKGKAKLVGGTLSNIATSLFKGGVVEADRAQQMRVAKRQMRKQVVGTRTRIYNQKQKEMADKMGVSLK